MQTTWFLILAAMVGIYVMLDGFDLGAGAILPFVARNEAERQAVREAIGPVWNGNEVWLIASGGVLFLAFPTAYASAFSGLYFGLILVLWLLIGRGLGFELREQVDSPLWRAANDAGFMVSSAALALVFGIALGNVVRGVPLGPGGLFELPLLNILNWYALLIGVFGLTVLAAHGANLLALRVEGAVRERAARIARRLWFAEAALFAFLAWPTHEVQPDQLSNLVDHPWTLVFPLLAAGSLLALFFYQRRGDWGRAFLSSSCFVLGLLATAAAGLYPHILPAREGNPNGLTIDSAAAGHDGLRTALFWWPVGIALAIAYLVVAYRLFFRSTVGPPAGSETAAAASESSSGR
jgi:cytochrome d ubiquinol oxidase subunit II